MNMMLSLLAVLFFAFEQPADEHRFPTHGFALVAPGDNWAVGPGRDTPGGFQVDLPRSGDGGLVAVSALCNGVPEGTRASELLKAGLAALNGRQEYRGHVLLDPSSIAGLGASGADVSWEIAGVGEVHIRMMYVVSGKRAWLLQGHSPLDRWEEVQPAVQSFFDGFRLIEIQAEDRAEMQLEELSERCGSELDWAPDWEAAAERSRADGKPILTVVRSYPGFDLPDTTRLFTFMDEDLLALVKAELVPLRLEAGMPAPMRDPAKYGMGPSTFGVALLLCDAEGEVLAETPHVQPAAARQWLWQELALTGWTRAVPGNPVEAARQALDRGQLEEGQLALERLLRPSEEGGQVLVFEQLVRAHRLRRDAAGALQVLDQAGPHAADARLVCARAEILLHLGDFAGARAALDPVLDGESSERPRALFLMALAAQEMDGVLAARPDRERLVRDHPDSRWAWQAAAMLAHEDLLLQADDGESKGGWPRAEVLAFLLDPPGEPGFPASADKSVEQATSWLLGAQRPEGSWPFSSELNRSASQAPEPLAIAINALSVRALLAQGQGARKAAKRGLEFLLEVDLKRREKPQAVVYMDYTAWAAWSQLELLCDALPMGLVDRSELLDWGGRLVADLQQRVRRNGGWSYFLSGSADGSDGPEQSISFTTGAVVIGLLRAKKAGVEVPDDLLAAALDCLEAMRNDDGYFAYMLHHPGDRPQHNTPAGAAGRGPVCELALLLGGRSDEQRLEHALTLYERHAGGLAAEGGKALMHAGADTQGCHYVFFDFMMASRAARHLGGNALARHRALALDLVLARRLTDGSFLDTPILGRAFGSAAALLTLESLGN